MVRCIVPLCADVETEMTHTAAPSADGPVGRYPRLVMPAASVRTFPATLWQDLFWYFRSDPSNALKGSERPGAEAPGPFTRWSFQIAWLALPAPPL